MHTYIISNSLSLSLCLGATTPQAFSPRLLDCTKMLPIEQLGSLGSLVMAVHRWWYYVGYLETYLSSNSDQPFRSGASSCRE